MSFQLSKLPNGWSPTTIGEITLPVATTTPADKPNAGFQYLDISSIDNQLGRITEPKQYLGKDAPSRARQVVAENDTLFSTVRTYLKNIAMVPAYLDSQVASTGFAVLRPSPVVEHRFLFHYVLTATFLHRLGELQRGTSYPAVRDSDVRAQPILLPPLAEQCRIVEKLEELFSELDKGIENLKLARTQLAVYRQSLLKHAFEGKLTAAWRAAHAKKLESADQLLAQMLSKRRKDWNGRGRYTEPVEPKTNELGTLPSQWVWASPEQLSSAENYSLAIGPFGSDLKVSDYTTSGVPLVFVRNIRAQKFGADRATYVSPEKAEKLRAHTVEGGDILITKMGEPPGDASIYPASEPMAVITADCIKLRLSPTLSQPRFFLHMINSAAFRQQIVKITSGVAQKKVSLGRFTSLALPLPPLQEQEQILSELDAQVSAIDALEADIDINLQKSEALRQSILKKAFAGELVPQDPSDEPAADLLTRIRASKKTTPVRRKKS